MSDLKLGKKPHTPDPRDFRLVRYLDRADLPIIPQHFGHQDVVHDWKMLGNDQYGDCVWAGAAHEHEMWSRESPTHADTSFTDASVLRDYAAATGFDPNNPASDQGTDMREAAGYRRSVGVLDAKGHRHKIAAYLSLSPGNLTMLDVAMYLFGAVGIGIEFPASAMDQFDRNLPWDYVRGSRIEGGHYVPGVGKLANGNYAVVTWGRVQEVTPRFLMAYMDEAYTYLSTQMLTRGLSPEGFSLTQLQADLAAL